MISFILRLQAANQKHVDCTDVSTKLQYMHQMMIQWSYTLTRIDRDLASSLEGKYLAQYQTWADAHINIQMNLRYDKLWVDCTSTSTEYQFPLDSDFMV